MNRQQKISIILIIAAVIAGAAYLSYPKVKNFISGFVETAKVAVDNKSEFVDTFKKEVLGGLIKKTGGTPGTLTIKGVILLTNKERIDQFLPALRENPELDKAAEIKINDMIANQYFDHISLDGYGPGHVADEAGYSYIIIGENLALGNFESDNVLVQAWMESPGHRANILNTKFSEIGVAVKEGTYKGEKVWFAVQEFGKPASSCPALDADLKASIDTHKQQLDILDSEIVGLKKEMQSMAQDTQDDRVAYNAKVDQFNKLVSSYNSLLKKLSSEISAYNAEVNSFNNCAND